MGSIQWSVLRECEEVARDNEEWYETGSHSGRPILKRTDRIVAAGRDRIFARKMELISVVCEEETQEALRLIDSIIEGHILPQRQRLKMEKGLL
ncbi:MAG TPA: hypothetical protein VN611_07675 [Patescibacteria group bacterium]|nr:hypothetical protein [Patescibacteria group bacterium]